MSGKGFGWSLGQDGCGLSGPGLGCEFAQFAVEKKAKKKRRLFNLKYNIKSRCVLRVLNFS
jgi:hypothetical protein